LMTELATAAGWQPLCHRILSINELSGRVAGVRKGGTDSLTGLDHPVGFGLTGSVCAIVAEADALQELGKLPSLRIGERRFDRDDLHAEGNASSIAEPVRVKRAGWVAAWISLSFKIETRV